MLELKLRDTNIVQTDNNYIENKDCGYYYVLYDTDKYEVQITAIAKDASENKKVICNSFESTHITTEVKVKGYKATMIKTLSGKERIDKFALLQSIIEYEEVLTIQKEMLGIIRYIEKEIIPKWFPSIKYAAYETLQQKAETESGMIDNEQGLV